MKIRTILIFLVLVSSSCVTEKLCQKRFPLVADTVRIVHFKDSIVYRDTIITIFLPGDTIIQTDSVIIPCPPPPPTYKPDSAKAEILSARAVAWWDYPVIRLVLTGKDTTVYLRLDSALRDAYYWKQSYEKITAIKKEIPKIYKIALWAWIGFFALILISFIRFLFWKK